MPHQCVRCNKVYDDGSKELLEGCSCGGKFFFFIKQGGLKEAKKITSKLSNEDKQQMEKDVFNIVGIEDEKPVVLDLESIKVLKPGKYELDLVDLFKGKPLVYKMEEGKYIIDVASTFKSKDLEMEEEGKKKKSS